MTQSTARSPRLLRRINTGLLLRFALASADFTAGEAMTASGLTRATVLGVCGDLVEAGWLEEIEDSRVAGLSQRGRPARRYRLREGAGAVVGVDAGENRFAVAVANLHGEVLASQHRRVDPSEVDRDDRVVIVRDLIRGVLADAGVAASSLLVTVVGIPAPVDAEGRSPEDQNIFWTMMNSGFQDRLEGFVVLENDANLAALAEQAASPGRNVATLLSGERFGAGLVVDGHLLRGGRGGAGEMRFLDLLVREDDLDLGSADGVGALARRWTQTELSRSDAPSSLRRLPLDRVDAEAVFAAARDGDALAEGILRRLGGRIAQIAMVLESILDVEKVVVAGGIAAAIGPVLGHARSILEAQFQPPFPELVASGLGRDVIVRGAVELALSRIREAPLDFLPAGAGAEPVGSGPQSS